MVEFIQQDGTHPFSLVDENDEPPTGNSLWLLKKQLADRLRSKLKQVGSVIQRQVSSGRWISVTDADHDEPMIFGNPDDADSMVDHYQTVSEWTVRSSPVFVVEKGE